MGARWRSVGMLAAMLMVIAGAGPRASAADLVRKIEVGGLTRTYRLHLPPGSRSGSPMALVVVLHGGGGNGSLEDKHTHFSAEADAQHFIVAYPDGTGRRRPFLNAMGRPGFLTWNAGICCGYAMEHHVDDVAFFRAMVEASDLVAAVGVVSGVVVDQPCKPASPVAVIHIHGDADQNVPLAGGVGRKGVSGTHYPPVQQSIDLWVAADGCAAAPVAATPAPGVTLRDWRGCRDGTEVAYYLIAGGGHAWPGGTQMAAFLDKPSTAMAATPVIWQFFAAHPKR